MKPLDPRLLRYAAAARRVLIAGAALGLLRTAAIIAWSWCIAQALAVLLLPVLGGEGGAAGRIPEGAAAPSELLWLLGGAALALIARAGSGWAMDVLAARGAVRAKAQLRSRALDAIDARSPEWAVSRRDADAATVLGRGLDALDGYFSGYLPQLILAACATPFLILAVLLADPVSGVIVLIVFPVIPIFMILIGLATQAVQDRQWQQLQRLSSSFLDVVTGLPTLKIFRREARQAERIARETDEYRGRTGKVLRVTFLSGFVLDLAGTFSIALVAVTVGTRLVVGEFPLALGLFVLLLLPEVFVPIRQVGAAFHASTEGLTASQQVFEIIEEETPARGAHSSHALVPASASELIPAHTSVRREFGTSEGENGCETLLSRSSEAGRGSEAGHAIARDAIARDAIARDAIALDGVVIARGDHAVVGPVSFDVGAGEIVGLAGPSGAGKSTLVAALLGFVDPAAGRITHPRRIAWAGQRPGLLQGSVAENVALGEAAPDAALVRRALGTVGLSGVDPALMLGAGGSGLSGGQAQRVSIARCLYRAWSRDTGAVVMDEPTSALDRASEARVCEALRAEADAGRAVLVVSHREAVLGSADRVVSLGGQS